ncbi:MAG: hypothetical protein A3G41_07335 [Elusimicrobia bacterium RIFCSPLOWO2_12_FULL_59_9]|nr:MAG: hypothetical protein A3G41_07335 [Elusimicrobia bacterium RIFCSPLOWO2_12_FULL_59_9]
MQKNEEAIASLWLWDVPFIAFEGPLPPISPLPPEKLLAALIQSKSGRLRLGAIAFLLRHPEKAESVRPALTSIDEETALLLKYYYTAAVYLQRHWKSALYDRTPPMLPDYFSAELRLPPPSLLHGKIGLHALEQALQEKSAQPFDYLSQFESVVQNLRLRAHA